MHNSTGFPVIRSAEAFVVLSAAIPVLTYIPSTFNNCCFCLVLQVNKYYDLATSFYEYGWGASFHFAHRWGAHCPGTSRGAHALVFLMLHAAQDAQGGAIPAFVEPFVLLES